MKQIIVILVLVLSGTTWSQEGNITIHKDGRLDALVKKQGEVIPPAINPEIDGYRVQLYFDSDRKVINDARSKFIAQFPKVDTYVEYNAPNFVLKVGDFRTKLEAEKIKAEVEVDFPTSFVIKEKINLPRLERE